MMKYIIGNLFDEKSQRTVVVTGKHVPFFLSMLLNMLKMRFTFFSKNFCKDIFDNLFLCECAEEFLRRKGILKIAITDNDLDESRFRKLISTITDVNISAYCFNDIFSNGKSVSFATMDECAYFYEPDRSLCRGIASANDKEFTRRLINSFNYYVESIK